MSNLPPSSIRGRCGIRRVTSRVRSDGAITITIHLLDEPGDGTGPGVPDHEETRLQRCRATALPPKPSTTGQRGHGRLSRGSWHLRPSNRHLIDAALRESNLRVREESANRQFQQPEAEPERPDAVEPELPTLEPPEDVLIIPQESAGPMGDAEDRTVPRENWPPGLAAEIAACDRRRRQNFVRSEGGYRYRVTIPRGGQPRVRWLYRYQL